MKNIEYSFGNWCVDNGHQDWIDLWDFELNKCSPFDVAYKSNKKYWFRCPRGLHPSEAKMLANVSSGKVKSSCNRCCSFGQWLLDNLGADAIDRYWSDKNDCSPFERGKSSGLKVWIKCEDVSHPDYLIAPCNFIHGARCSVCINHKVITGINDIATTHLEFVKYFKNKDDATIYSVRSGKVVWFKCPLCGYERCTTIDKAFGRGHYSCPCCDDGVSYNNKFIYNVLHQLSLRKGLKFESEKIFEWSTRLDGGHSKKIYDFYINTYNIIIEAHGAQHYQDNTFVYLGGKTLQQEQENDLLKRNLAISNGVSEDCYVVIDCRKCNVEFIKTNIMNSNLPKLLSFNEEDIDWVKCGQFAANNMVKMACDIWNNGVHNIKKIGQCIGRSTSTVCEYLTKGHALKWIDYEPSMKKPVICTDNGYVFPYSVVCSNYSKKLFGVFISRKCINNNACGDSDSTHGFHFEYLTRKEYQHIKDTEPYRVFE